MAASTRAVKNPWLTVADCRQDDPGGRQDRTKDFRHQGTGIIHVAAVKKLLAAGPVGKIYRIQLTALNRNPFTTKLPGKGTLKLDGGTPFTQFSLLSSPLLVIAISIPSQAYLGTCPSPGNIEFETLASSS